jgi:putative tricarboxylic transport membrane protein
MSNPSEPTTARGLRSDQVSGLMLVALALYVGWMNRAYPIGSLQEPGPGYVPLLLAIFLGVMGLLVVIAGGKSTPLSQMEWGESGRALAILVACGMAAYAMERLGFRITMAALLVFFLGVMERRQPVRVAVVSLGFAFIAYYLFATLLRVPLPVSPWGV